MNKGKGKGRDPAVDRRKLTPSISSVLAFRHVDTLSGDGRQGFGLDYANYNYAGNLGRLCLLLETRKIDYI